MNAIYHLTELTLKQSVIITGVTSERPQTHKPWERSFSYGLPALTPGLSRYNFTSKHNEPDPKFDFSVADKGGGERCVGSTGMGRVTLKFSFENARPVSTGPRGGNAKRSPLCPI